MTEEGLHCQLTAALTPWGNATRLIDHLYWPTSYAGAVAARHVKQHGAAGAMSRRAVCDHIAAVYGWPEARSS